MAKSVDKLEKTLRKATPEDLMDALLKDTGITVRVSSQDKRELKAAATFFSLSVTEYLLRLHRFAEDLRKRRKA